MVAFAEATVVALYCPGDTLEEIHDLACERAKKKFKPILDFQAKQVG